MLANLLQTIDGKKTYILIGLGAAVILVNHFIGQIPGTPADSPDWLNQLYILAMARR
jgi:hypothetical protein